MHQPGQHRLVGTDVGHLVSDDFGGHGRAQRVFPQMVGQIVERHQILGPQQLVHGDGHGRGANRIQSQADNGRLDAADFRPAAAKGGGVGQAEQASRDQRLEGDHVRQMVDGQIGILQGLA